MVLVNLLLIGFIMVNLIDLSGFMVEMKKGLWKFLFKKKVPLDSIEIPKPFSCSYCMTWWSGLIYLLIIWKLSLFNIATLLLICFLTPIIGSLEILVKDCLSSLLEWLYKVLKIE